jgi:hypothetical protein
MSMPSPDPRSGRQRRDLLDLLRYRDERRDDRADIIDMLTMHPDEGPEGGTAAWRDRGHRDILILGL